MDENFSVRMPRELTGVAGKMRLSRPSWNFAAAVE